MASNCGNLFHMVVGRSFGSLWLAGGAAEGTTVSVSEMAGITFFMTLKTTDVISISRIGFTIKSKLTPATI